MPKDYHGSHQPLRSYTLVVHHIYVFKSAISQLGFLFYYIRLETYQLARLVEVHID